MNLDRGSILFNRTIDQCRSIGRLGGRARARNLHLRKARSVAPVQEPTCPHKETAAEAIARIDALCPWLRGIEFRTAR
jgi:hypothetical protein